MADRVEIFQVTVNALTLSPVTTDLEFVDGVVERIDILFPDGCLGLVRARLLYGGTQVIPSRAQSFTGNNETVPFPLSGLFPTGARWQVSLENSGLFAHTIEVRIYLAELPAPRPTPDLPLPIA